MQTRFDVFLQPFLSFKHKAECHLKERYFRRRFRDGEAETHEFGVAQPLEYELSDSNNLVNAKVEQGGVSTFVWKQMRDTSQNPSVHSPARQQEDTQNADTWKKEKRSD